MQSTWVVGGYQTDFARAYAKEGLGLADLIKDAAIGALEDSHLSAAEIEAIHVGNAFAPIYCNQTHLGAMVSSTVPEFWGTPAASHEAACASSSIALLAATAELEARRYGCVLVVGAEQERTMPGSQAAAVQNAASWVGHENQGVELVWPYTFNILADEYDRRYGIDEAHLRAIGEINMANAKHNPRAQTRDWVFTEGSFEADDASNPLVAGRLRRNDCCQLTDGAVGLVVVSDEWLKAHPTTKPLARVAGWGHATVGLSLDSKLARDDGDFVMPHVRKAALDAQRRAGVGIEHIDSVEAHDCMTPSEYLAIDHLGITAPGMSFQAIEDGTIARSGALPINPGGGLIGGGHPVGATGARMVLDCVRQVSGTAGDTQVDGARRAQTLNIGGSTATTVSFILESVES